MVASGTFGYGPEYDDLVDYRELGALVVKGISLEPTGGNPTPRTVEVASGLINAIGLQNPGVAGFVSNYLPFLRTRDVPVVVNIWGRSIAEYGEVAERLSREPGIHALEINVSCPNIKEGSRSFGTHPDLFRRVLNEVRRRTSLPMIPKLAPMVPDIGDYARWAVEEGADAISLINSIPAMAIDVETRRPALGNITGGLTGPAIHPVAVKLVWEAARAVRVPIVAMGGIRDAKDALEFILAGATAVAVGTATFAHPTTCLDVIGGIRDYLVRQGVPSVEALRGAVKT
jgi:dihydroorotate dehydrogenase (NAD+) catalytic subunit